MTDVELGRISLTPTSGSTVFDEALPETVAMVEPGFNPRRVYRQIDHPFDLCGYSVAVSQKSDENAARARCWSWRVAVPAVSP